MALKQLQNPRPPALRGWTFIIPVLILLSATRAFFNTSQSVGARERLMAAGLIVALGFVFIFPLLRRRSRGQLWATRVQQGMCPYCGNNVKDCTDRCSECGRMIPSAVDHVLDARKRRNGEDRSV